MKLATMTDTRPFIKWVGGKRQLLPELLKFMPNRYNRYYEPFLGGGALLLRVCPNNAVINDYNGELVNAWRIIRDNVDGLIRSLKQHRAYDCKSYYLAIRSADRDGRLAKMSPTERASRFIYLNKAGFNGLWRVNRKGQCNVPFGGHKNLNVTPSWLRTDSRYLRNANVTITNRDYAKAVTTASDGDFIYFDPPYIPLTATSDFTSYTTTGFGLKQQKRLVNLSKRLAAKGAKVMLSNSSAPLTYKLYDQKPFHIHEVAAGRAINSNPNKRGKIKELIITTY